MKEPKNKCQGLSPNNKPCRSRAVMSNGYCYFHSPDHKEIHRENAAKGGVSAKKERLGLPANFKIRNSKDVKKLLDEYLTVISHAGVPNTPSAIQAMSKLAETYIKVEDKAEVQDKMLELERRAGG